ncbi:MAG: hypothetical protein U0R26_06865 [Solirubrobacterales bacterium]
MYRTRPPLLGLAVAVALALWLPACGDQGRAATGKTAAPSRHRAKAPASARACRSQIGSFLASLDSLRNRLVAGVSYQQYVDHLKAVRKRYEELPVDGLELDCLTDVATSAEQSFNEYIAAANTWSDCVEVPSCESASIESALQRRWRVASHYLSEAQTGLGPSTRSRLDRADRG